MIKPSFGSYDTYRHRHRALDVGNGSAVNAAKPSAMKESIEVIEYFETSASLTGHVDISLFQQFRFLVASWCVAIA
jgi:hypothetical protein